MVNKLICKNRLLFLHCKLHVKCTLLANKVLNRGGYIAIIFTLPSFFEMIYIPLVGYTKLKTNQLRSS
jgi:hypothetical protein